MGATPAINALTSRVACQASRHNTRPTTTRTTRIPHHQTVLTLLLIGEAFNDQNIMLV